MDVGFENGANIVSESLSKSMKNVKNDRTNDAKMRPKGSRAGPQWDPRELTKTN